MVSYTLAIEVADSAEKAPKYSCDFIPANIEKAVIVAHGTKDGNPTVDLQIKDDRGNKYLVMVTGALLETLACAIKGVRERS